MVRREDEEASYEDRRCGSSDGILAQVIQADKVVSSGDGNFKAHISSSLFATVSYCLRQL